MSEKKDKHSMIVMLDQARADIYKEVALKHGKTLSQWVRIVLDKACRQQGIEPESMLHDSSSSQR
jgi:hypothetical protein